MNSSQTIEIFLKKKIKYKREDTYLNHLKTYFGFDSSNYSGMVNNKEFKVWRNSSSARLFYIVVSGQIITSGEKIKIELSCKMNKVGQLLTVLIFIGFFVGMYSFDISTTSIGDFLLRLIFASLPTLGIGLGYLQERKNALKDIMDLLKSDTNIVFNLKRLEDNTNG